MSWILLLAGLGSFLLALVSVPIVRRISMRTGFLDHPGPRKIHTTPIPYGGGLSVAFGFLAVMAAGLAGAWLITRGTDFGLPAGVLRHAKGAVSKAQELVVLAGGSLVILLLGLVDDKRRLSPRFKLFVQVIVATGFVVGGERLSLFWEDSLAGNLLGGAITVVWIVGITNAFNLLDHMDGIASGAALLACIAFGVVAWLTQQWFVAAAIAALGGACAGFLVFNFPPAKIFLGDAGSLFIGYVMATLTVTFTFYEKSKSASPYSYAIPLAVLAVPLYDTACVILTRLRNRRPIFEGDRNHLAHRLSAMGLGPRGAVLTVYCMSALTGLSAILLLHADRTGVVIILSQLALTFGIIGLLNRPNASTNQDPTRPNS